MKNNLTLEERFWQKYIVYERELGLDHPLTRDVWFEYKFEKLNKYKLGEEKVKVKVLTR
jgi:hypothetical protein